MEDKEGMGREEGEERNRWRRRGQGGERQNEGREEREDSLTAGGMGGQHDPINDVISCLSHVYQNTHMNSLPGQSTNQIHLMFTL